MKGQKYTVEQIVAKLREGEVLLGRRMARGEVCRQLEITDVTYYACLKYHTRVNCRKLNQCNLRESGQ